MVSPCHDSRQPRIDNGLSFALAPGGEDSDGAWRIELDTRDRGTTGDAKGLLNMLGNQRTPRGVPGVLDGGSHAVITREARVTGPPSVAGEACPLRPTARARRFYLGLRA